MFIDVSITIDMSGVAGFHQITVTDNVISPPTSDVVDINTISNVRVSIGQVQRQWRVPVQSR